MIVTGLPILGFADIADTNSFWSIWPGIFLLRRWTKPTTHAVPFKSWGGHLSFIRPGHSSITSLDQQSVSVFNETRRYFYYLVGPTIIIQCLVMW